MEITRNFDKLSKNDVGLAGGKGASLGEMTRAGIPVPSGFVILSNAFERFIHETELVADIEATLDSVNHEEIHTIENASEKIMELLLEAEMPKDIEKEIIHEFDKLGAKFVAVRSSATAEDSSTAAWAGQLESYLNTTEDTLIENVKRCWASLFTPRAIFYRFEKNLHKEKVSVAVVIQKMVESEESGIAFSVHPVTQDRNQLIIEAGFGLGEAIVSGQITPDSYVVLKDKLKILDKNINEQRKGLYRKGKGGNEWKDLSEKGKKQVLSDKEIIELSKLIIHIEKHYGFPVDVEWAREKGKFYIVQSRPITTLGEKVDGKNIEENKLSYKPVFTRPYSLIREEWENVGEYDELKRLTNGKYYFKPLFIYDPIKKTTVYYNFTSSEESIKNIIEYLNENIKSFKNDLQKAKKLCKRVDELIKLDKADPKELFELLKKIQPFSSIGNPIGRLPFATKELLELFKKYRSDYDELEYKAEKLLLDIAKKSLKLELKDYASFLTFDEIFNQKSINTEEIRKRKNGYIFFINEIKNINELQQLLDKYNIKIIEERLEKDLFIAYKGKARGKVSVIYSEEDFSKFKEGDILVTTMSNPNFLPIMKKAAAIITDEGGITSHAAIVARELKIPSIIGTKNATQLYHDGDLVEVDADNGVVKILEKANTIKEKNHYELYFSRDFCLANIEIWCRGESTEPRQWTEKQQPIKPYILFERKNGIVNCYMCDKGVEWIKKELKNQIKKNPDYIKCAVNIFNEKLKSIKDILDNELTLNYKELIKFIDDHLDSWPWFEATWWLMELISEDNPNSDELKLLEKCRKDTESYGDACDRVLIKSLKKIFPDLGELSTVLSIEEIKKKNIPSKDVLKNRMNHYIYAEENLFEKENLDDIRKKYNIEINENTIEKFPHIIHGKSAYPGKVIGKVKIIIGRTKVKELKKDEILVTPMTTVDFLPAMKTSSAIITDEGGVTCHAAIVARELKKPCIIGTKIATQVLRDGDLVEVDANQGIVKILERAQR